MELVHIYAQPTVKWQVRYANALRTAFVKFGYTVEVRTRHVAPLSAMGVLNVLLGPNYWQSVQTECRQRGFNYLMVNRAYWGDPDYVCIGWNGFNGHADCITENVDGQRWERIKPYEPLPQRHVDAWGNAVVMGQFHAHSFEYDNPDTWVDDALYETRLAWPGMHVAARPHPGKQNTGPLDAALRDCSLMVTLNSTVAIEGLLRGIPVVAQDSGNALWSYVPQAVARANHQPTPAERQLLLHRLAYCQWSCAEIPEAGFLEHLTQRNPVMTPMPVFTS
jgi:hypothetical protein